MGEWTAEVYFPYLEGKNAPVTLLGHNPLVLQGRGRWVMISDNGLWLSHGTISTSTFWNYSKFAFVWSRCGSKKKFIGKIPTGSIFMYVYIYMYIHYIYIFCAQVFGALPHPATRPSKTHSMADRAIPRSVCHQGRAAIYSANSIRWHKCKSGWSLKTEKIHCQWHVYIDTTHTIRHLFLTWTSLYPFTFLKTQLKHMRQSAWFFFDFWLAILSEQYLKGPKREIFGFGIFAQTRPIWIG